MIVTIDGPAGAGKSSIARQLAAALQFEFLDTGALYRAVTLGAMRADVPMTDAAALVRYASNIQLDWSDRRILLDGQDVTDQIRTPEVTSHIRCIADPPDIRELLSRQQRRFAEGRDIVTEGRDQGSEVFPDAECKIFLTASPEERAKRRHKQLEQSGQPSSYEEILAAQNQRDLEDRLRPVGRLRAARDAVIVPTDGLSSSDVLGRVLDVVRQCLARTEAAG
ncbi:MAG: (d)CMP kinase [Planctomycetota bacterium]